jgi:hypothetical protein
MKNIQLSHIKIQQLNCAIFGADAIHPTDSSRAELLAALTHRARGAGFTTRFSPYPARERAFRGRRYHVRI